MSTKIDNGTIAEYKFAAKAMSHGLLVAWPASDYSYDFVLDNGRKLIKVQVKSTFTKTANQDSYTIKCKRGTAKTRKGYTDDDCDFIAAYVADFDVFYIIPTRVIGGRQTIQLYPHRSGVGQFEGCREEWGKFR